MGGLLVHGQMHSHRNCGARELPCALPANSRNSTQDSLAQAKSSRGPISSSMADVTHSPESDSAFLAFSAPAQSNNPQSHSPSFAFLVLRI